MSAKLRELYDSGSAEVNTKQDPLRVKNVNLSAICHITKEELVNSLTSVDRANGFGNRFMYL